jgi:L-methionine (R)-S-oxide reductase
MSKEEKYRLAYNSLVDFFSIYSPRLDDVGVMATISSVVKSHFSSLIFVGFYIMKNIDGTDVLEIGPYQGDVLACARIDIGNGVCGTSAYKKETVLVPDVSQFERYIACDNFTKSEIVVPVLFNQELKAVFDVDSGDLNYFDEVDKLWLEKIVSEFL